MPTNPNPFLRSSFDALAQPTLDEAPTPQLEMPEVPAAPVATEQPVAPVAAPRAKSDNLAPPPELHNVFEASARQYGVPVDVLMALAHQESRYNPAAVGQETKWGRAKGIMQYLDDTAGKLGIDALDPNQAIPAAAKQLRDRLDAGASMDDAVKEHFAGPDRKGWKEKTHAYGAEVLGKAGQIGDLLYAAAPEETSPKEDPKAAGDLAALPITPEYLAALKDQWNGATVGQRNQMAKRGDYLGYVARTMNQKQPTAPTAADANSLFAPLNPTAAQQVDKAYATPGIDAVDPKAEARARQHVREGMNGDLANQYAQTEARRGMPLGGDSKLEASQFDFATQKQYNSDPFYSNPVVRAAVKGYEGYKQGVIGVNQALGELVGADVSGQKQMGDESRAKTTAMGEANNYGQRMFEGAVQSIAQQLPALIGGAATGSEALTLGAMFTQSFGQEYSEGRSSGQTVEQAQARAALFATFEVVGEKFGLGDTIKGLRGATQGMATKDVATLMAKALMKEVPGEELTTLGQFATDKLPGGIGLHTEAGLADYLIQAGDTLVQTVLQGGMMMGGATATSHAISKVNTAERQIAREINRQVDEVQFVGQDDVARAATDPNNESIDPRYTRRTPGQMPAQAAVEAAAEPAATAAPDAPSAPVTPAGPLSSAVHAAAPDELTIMGDDGTPHVLKADGTIEPVAAPAAPAGPLAGALHEAAASHAESPIAPPEIPSAQAAPAAPPPLEGLSLDELRAQMQTVAGTIKTSGRTAELVEERKRIEKELGQRAKEARDATKKAADAAQITMGPFDNVGEANRMALRAAESTQTPHEVVEKSGKFSIQPIKEQGDGKGAAVPEGRTDGAGSDATAVRPGPADGGRPAKPRPVPVVDSADAGRDGGKNEPDHVRAERAADGKPALKEWEKNPYHARQFADEPLARAFMDKNKVDGEKFEAVQTGTKRWKVQPKDESVTKPAHAREDAVQPVVVETKLAALILRETRGGKDRFHGTSRPMPDDKPSNDYAMSGDSRNIYGQGFYTTDAADISHGYMRKGKGNSPTLYEVGERGTVKLYDMEAPLTPEMHKMLNEVMGDVPTHNDDTGEQLTNLREVFDEYRANSQGEGLTRNDVQEVFDGIRDNLERQGYRGYQHTGGLRTKNAPHEVRIYWTPEDDINVTKSDIAKYSADAPQESAAAPKAEPTPSGPKAAPKTPKESKLTEARAKHQRQEEAVKAAAENIAKRKAAEPVAAAEKVQPAKKDTPAPESTAPAAPIGDFGEKIHGAKKDIWTSYKETITGEMPSDGKDITLSKHFPEPNYEAAIADGVAVDTLAAIKAMRDAIPAKPKVPYKLRAWADKVTTVREFAARLMSGNMSMDTLMKTVRGLNTGAMREFADRIEMYRALGYPLFTKASDYTISENHYSMFNGESPPGGVTKFELKHDGTFRSGYFDTHAQAIDALRTKLESAEDVATGRVVKLDLYRLSSGDIVIGKKVGTGKYIDLKTGFTGVREARAYLAEHNDELVKLLEQKKDIQPERRSVNQPRIGEDRRKGEDVTPEQFGNNFGFRGVQFGNYVEQGRRARDLNNAYDALHDMADITGIPAKAISLNGSLGLAFGARGSGGKNAPAAHYEPGQVVINLTKTNGAGSLAHEWWHALDNYFSKARGDNSFLTLSPRQKMVADANRKMVPDESIRPETIEAFKGVMDAIMKSGMPKRSKGLDARKSKDYWSTSEELSARAFESYIIDKAAEKSLSNDYLANIVSEQAHEARNAMSQSDDPFPYPIASEKPSINAAFDKLFETLETRENGNNVELFDIPGGRTIEVDGVRRPINDADGKLVAPTVAGQMAFWRFFKNSKVTDSAGRPQMVFHGTRADISEFKKGVTPENDGIFFTRSPEVAGGVYANGGGVLTTDNIRVAMERVEGFGSAEPSQQDTDAAWKWADSMRRRNRRFDWAPEELGTSYAQQVAEYARAAAQDGNESVVEMLGEALGVSTRANAEGANIVPAYLSMQNPKEIDGSKSSFDDGQQEQWIADARADGHDGLIIKAYDDGGYGGVENYQSAGRHTVYIAFKPEQVKSATGNAGSFSAESGSIVHDFTREETRALMMDGPLSRMEEPKRVAVLANLKRLQKLRGAGKIDDEAYRAQVENLIGKIGERNQARENAKAVDKERGPLWVEERLMRAMRQGELDSATVDFALWALRKSPSLAADLAISLKSKTAHGSAGSYGSADRIMTLLKNGTNDGTAVHEMLHHTERMMPAAIQKGIVKAWIKAYSNAWTRANPETRTLLEDLMAGGAGDKQAFERTVEAFRKGKLDYDAHYQLVNASEFWAVNATRIMSGRFNSDVHGNWIAKAKQWLTEMVQYVKGALGLRSDAPILKALSEVLNGTGERQSKSMLGQLSVARDMAKALYQGRKTVLDKDGRLSVNMLDAEENLSDAEYKQKVSNWQNDVGVPLNSIDTAAVIKRVNSMTWHHGSADTGIDTLEARSNGGLFLTSDPKVAGHYAGKAGRVYEHPVAVKKPFFVETSDLTADMEGSGEIGKLAALGYDAIVPLDYGDLVLIAPQDDFTAHDITAGAAPRDESAADADGLTAPPQGWARTLQSHLQDNLNRVKQQQEHIEKVTGVPIKREADYYGAEINRPGRIAARLEDAQDQLTKPLMEKLAKSGYKPAQLNELLHAMHAHERNEAVARINPEFPDGGSGMTDEAANEVIDKYKDAAELHELANEARKIAAATLDLKLAYGLITADQHETLTEMYEHYVPLKGDGEYGPKIKRAMGHDEREEFIIDNIARDYAQAVVVGEKNLARQSLLQMVLRHPDDNLWTARVPPKGRYVAGTVLMVKKGDQTVASFTAKSQVSAFLEAKGPEAGQYTVETSAGEQVVEFTKPLQDNEVMVYVKGQPVRLQIHDAKLASQLRPLDAAQMNAVGEFARNVNRHLSKVYTGYNPSFILRNTARDAMTGTINMVGNQGATIAAKAWANYPKAVLAMGKWAATKKVPGGQTGAYLDEYRQHGGKVGASWMSDLEDTGKSLQEMYDNQAGLVRTAKDAGVVSRRAANVAWNKTVGKLAHVIEVANAATENGLRLALFMTLREAGHAPGIAAQAAKGVTVDFDRKGTATPALGAAYLFLNPAIQGTANAGKTLFKGEHKYQAWGLLGGLASLGYLLAARGMDDDKDRWLGEGWETRSKNVMIRAGDHQVKIPVSQEFAPFFAMGAAVAEATRGESVAHSSARVISSFIDAYFPLQVWRDGSDNHLADAGMALVPTVLKPVAEIASNRNAFGSDLMPETEFTKDRPDNLKMHRGTKGSMFDKAAQGIASVSIAAGISRPYENDITKVSPETLKMLWRTYTGGLGTFIADSAGAAALMGDDPKQMESSDIPFVKDFYRPLDSKPLAGRYYELARDAKRVATEMSQAEKNGDADAIDQLRDSPDWEKFGAMAKTVTYFGKRAGQLGDEAVDVNSDKTLTNAQKRAELKRIDAEKEELYRDGIEAFKK